MRNLYGVISCCVLLLLAVALDNAHAKKPQKSAEVSAIYLDVLKIRACAVGQGCSTVGGPKQWNLFDLAEGKTDFANQVLMPAKTHELRLMLGSKSTITVDGQTYSLTVPSGQVSGLKLKGNKVFASASGFLKSIRLNFDLAKGLVVQTKKVKGKGKKDKDTLVYSYSLKPVIQVSSAEITPMPENMAAVVALPDKENKITLGDKFSLFIPAGAVSVPVVITVEEIQNLVYKLSPDDHKFAKQVTISMKYNSDLLRDVGYSGYDLIVLRNGIEFPSSTDIKSETLTVDTLKFSTYALAAHIPDLAYYLAGCFASNDIVEYIPNIMRYNKKWNLSAKLMDHWFGGIGENYMVNLGEIIDLEPNLAQTVKQIMLNAKNNNAISVGSVKIDDHPLIKGLKETPNSNGGMVIPDGGSFNHIKTELSSANKECADKELGCWRDLPWEKDNMYWIKTEVVNASADLSEYTASFNKAVLRLVAKGNVTVENNIATINVDGIGVYFKDSYDFIDKSLISQPLGCWSPTTSPYVNLLPFSPDSTCICNSTFRRYNINNGKQGDDGDFRIFSDPNDSKWIFPTKQIIKYEIKTKIDNIYPLEATIEQPATFTVTGQNLPSTLTFQLDACLNVTPLPSIATSRQFRCTPSYTLGEKSGVITDEPGGTVLKNFTVHVVADNTPIVNSVLPDEVFLNELTTFTVTGQNLPSTLDFWFEGCEDMEPLGGNSTSMQFRCTPSSEGSKSGIVTTRPYGVTLKEFMVNVINGNAPVVNSISPASATLGIVTDFTIMGKNLPSTLAFWVDQCAGVESLGGSSTYMQFRCTPSYSTGEKSGVLKDAPGGNVLKNFSVNFIAAPPPSDDELVLKAVKVTANETLYACGTATYKATADLAENITTGSLPIPGDVVKSIEVADQCTWLATPTMYATSLGNGLVQAKSGTAGYVVNVKCSYYHSPSNIQLTGTLPVTIK